MHLGYDYIIFFRGYVIVVSSKDDEDTSQATTFEINSRKQFVCEPRCPHKNVEDSRPSDRAPSTCAKPTNSQLHSKLNVTTTTYGI